MPLNACAAVAEETLKISADGRGVHFNRELEAGEQRLREALAPYTRFVRVERERVVAIRGALERLQLESEALRQRIEGMQARTVPLAS